MEETFEVRDLRKKEFFQVNDLYLNGYAKYLGPIVSSVYFSLCRHADTNQTCFPSQALIAGEFGMSKRTVIRAIAKLADYKIIRVTREKQPDGKWGRNNYLLLDKKCWRRPSDTKSSGKPGDRKDQNQVTQSHTKDTHIKETHITPLYSPLKKKRLEDIGEEDYLEISNRYKVNPSFVKYQHECLKNYVESKGKPYKDYLAALRNFVLKGMREMAERPRKGGFVDATNL